MSGGRVHASWLIETFGVSSVQLARWRRCGMLYREGRTRWGGDQRSMPAEARPRAAGSWFEGWARRMVPLLQMTRTVASAGSVQGHPRREVDVLRDVAAGLHIDPEAAFVVILGNGEVVPCRSAAGVVDLHRGQVCTTVVAVPE